MFEIIFTFTYSVDTDVMQHYAAFHLGLHCLQKYSFRGFPNTNGYESVIIFQVTVISQAQHIQDLSTIEMEAHQKVSPLSTRPATARFLTLLHAPLTLT